MENVVFLLDLDGTLQGDIGPQVREYDLLKNINSRVLGNKIRYNLQHLYKDMDSGLIRPHMVKAIRNITQQHKNVDFFVYTASSDEWGNYIVRQIIKKYFEKDKCIHTDIIFTRKHCVLSSSNNFVYKKSIEKIKPFIIKSLKDKYGKFLNPYVFLVDNNHVLLSEEKHNLIKCPTYEYKVVINPLRNISRKNILNNVEWLSKYFMINKKTFFPDLKTKLEFEVRKSNALNIKNVGDNYWEKFDSIMKTKFKNKKDIMKTISKLKRI
jgi:hypothetical protein